MEIFQVLNLASEYLVISIVCLVLIGLVYLIFFRKILNKYIKFNTKRAIVFCLLFSYILIVIGATIFKRIGVYEHANLHLFSSYVEAWNNYSKSFWRNIILNILMFVPLGILLPLYAKVFRKFYLTFLVGFLFTLAIEVTQYFTKRGIFELDDLFNNFIGTVLGYCLIMIILMALSKEKVKYKALKIALCIVPITASAMAYYKITDAYNKQDLGNLSINYNYEYDMSGVELDSEVEFSEDEDEKYIYVINEYTEEDALDFARGFFAKANKILDESATEVTNNEVSFYSEDKRFVLYCNLNKNTFSFSDLDNKYYDSKKVGVYSEKYIRQILDDYNVELPDIAEFDRVYYQGELDEINSNRKANQVDEDYSDEYRFTVSNLKQRRQLLDGYVYVSNTEKVLTVDNYIAKYEPREKYDIISENEAYDEIKKGRFNAYEMYNIKSIDIKSLKLCYRLDSKGFYQPVYQFECTIDGQGRPIFIPALRECLP